jgi:HK97 gp10 family phage protein
MPSNRVVISFQVQGLDKLLTELAKRGDKKRLTLATRIALSKGAGLIKNELAASAPAGSDEATRLLNRPSAWKVFVSKAFKSDWLNASVGPDHRTLYAASGATKKSMKTSKAEKGYGKTGGGAGARPWIKGGAAYFRTAASVANAVEYGNSKVAAQPFFTRAFMKVRAAVEEGIISKLREFVDDPDKVR